MSDFGDFEPDDAYDPSRADPEQVARRLQAYRRDTDDTLPSWEAMTAEERIVAISVITRLLAWLYRSGSL